MGIVVSIYCYRHWFNLFRGLWAASHTEKVLQVMNLLFFIQGDTDRCPYKSNTRIRRNGVWTLVKEDLLHTQGTSLPVQCIHIMDGLKLHSEGRNTLLTVTFLYKGLQRSDKVKRYQVRNTTWNRTLCLWTISSAKTLDNQTSFENWINF